jgi:hypothetical protein
MKAKQTKPSGASSNGNNVGGDSLNQSNGGGGSHRQADGSLNLKGFGKGGNNNGIVKSGFGNSPIPKDEQ